MISSNFIQAINITNKENETPRVKQNPEKCVCDYFQCFIFVLF